MTQIELPPTTLGPTRSFTTTVCWLIIAGCLATIMARNWRDSTAPEGEGAAKGFELLVQSRYSVGANMLLPQTAGISHLSQSAPMSAAVKSAASTPRQKLRADMVVGELEGAKAAIAELKADKAIFDAAQLAPDVRSLVAIYSGSAVTLSDQQRQHLIDEHGWFGKLALSFGQDAHEPLRHEVMRDAVRSFSTSIGMAFVVLLAVLAGIPLLTIAIVRIVDGNVQFAYRPADRPASAFLEGFTLYLALMVLSMLAGRWILHLPRLVVTAISLAWLPLPMLWPLVRGVSWADLRRGLGWHAGRGIVREAAMGIVGYFAGLPLMIMGMELTTLLMNLTGARAIHPIVFSVAGGWRQALILYFFAAVLAPIVEETLFRGALFHSLRRGHRFVFSALVVSLIFAALHPQGWAAIPALGTIGFIFAAIREWRGTTISSAAAHALNNGVLVTVLLLTAG